MKSNEAIFALLLLSAFSSNGCRDVLTYAADIREGRNTWGWQIAHELELLRNRERWRYDEPAPRQAPAVSVRVRREAHVGTCVTADLVHHEATEEQRYFVAPAAGQPQRRTRTSLRVRRLAGVDCTLVEQRPNVAGVHQFTVRLATALADETTAVVFEPATVIRVVAEPGSLPRFRVNERVATSLELEHLQRFPALVQQAEPTPSLLRDGTYRVGESLSGSLRTPVVIPWLETTEVIQLAGVGRIRRLLGEQEQHYELLFEARRVLPPATTSSPVVTVARAVRALQPRDLEASDLSREDMLQTTARGEREEEGVRFRYVWRRTQNDSAVFGPSAARPAEVVSSDAQQPMLR